MKTLEQIVRQLAALPDPDTTPDPGPSLRIEAQEARPRTRQRGVLAGSDSVDRPVCR